MIWIIMLLVGLALGAALGEELGAAIGGILGLTLGAVVQSIAHGISQANLKERIARLETDIASIHAQLARQSSADKAGALSAAAQPAASVAGQTAEKPPPPPEKISPLLEAAPASPPSPAPAAAMRQSAPPPPPPDEVAAALRKALAWAGGGNLVTRLGVLILFVGVGFLMKYGIEHQLFPPELRLAAVAAGAMAMLAIGWRTRTQNDRYGLALQGGGIGLLYLDIFGAMRLYSLLPSGTAFIMMVLVCGLAAMLAILQDASVLAIMGTTGGFLAPVLTSSGHGSHVSLFSYYALLDIGILAIAWFRAWRPLNLLGFLFTYGIGAAWGGLAYQPDLLASTEPFVILFFGLFLTVSLLYARRRDGGMTHYVDGTLLFGTPAATLGIQTALLHNVPFGMAWTAIALSFVYLGTAFFVRHLPLLFQALLILGTGFGTLAIPLTAGGQTTASIWALEGAFLLWLALRQNRIIGIAAGCALQILAAGAFAFSISGPDAWLASTPFAHAGYLAAVMIAAAGLACGFLFFRFRPAAALQGVFALWAAAWWLGATGSEIHHGFLRNWYGPASEMNAYLALAVATGWLGYLARRLLQWTTPALAAAALPPVLLGWVALFWLVIPQPPLLLIFLGAAIATLALLRLTENDLPPVLRAPPHPVLLWASSAMLVCAVYEHAGRYVPEGTWRWSASGYGLALGLGLLLLACRSVAWPFRRYERAYLLPGASPAALALTAFVLLSALSDGDAAPLPYLPLLNPLDIAVILAMLCLTRWWRRLATIHAAWSTALLRPAAVLSWMVFINAVLLRTLHHMTGVPYTAQDLFASVTVQAAISVFWTCLALAAMVLAARKASRLPWLLGAGLLGITLLKMFLFDLSYLQGGSRIAVFISVGVLLLAIGYFSPLPPRQRDTGDAK